MSTIAPLLCDIETEPAGFRARFTVEPSDDFPSRCFDALARHRIEPRSLSIFRGASGGNRISVTLASGLCARSKLQEVLDELTRSNHGESPDPHSVP